MLKRDGHQCVYVENGLGARNQRLVAHHKLPLHGIVILLVA